MGRMIHCQSHLESRGDRERAAKGERTWRLSMLFALKLILLFVVLPVRLQCLSARLNGGSKSEQALNGAIAGQGAHATKYD